MGPKTIFQIRNRMEAAMAVWKTGDEDETVLAVLSDGAERGSLVYETGRLLYVERDGARERVRYGEEASGWYPIVLDLITNGRTWAFTTHDGVRRFVVTGAAEGTRYDYVSDPWFEGDEVIYYAREGARHFAVRGHEEQKRYDRVSDADIADGRLVYPVEKDGRMFAVWGSEERGPHDLVWDVRVVDGTLQYCARDGNRERVVCGDTSHASFANVGLPIMLGNTPVYRATDGGADIVVLGCERSPARSRVWDLSVQRGTAVWCASDGRRSFVESPGRRWPDHDEVYGPQLADGRLDYIAGDRGTYRVVTIQGTSQHASAAHDEITGVARIGQTLTYRTRDRRAARVHVGRVRSTTYAEVGGLVQTGGMWCFPVRRGRRWYVARDCGRRLDGPFRSVLSLRAHRNRAIAVVETAEGLHVWIDGVSAAKPFDQVLTLTDTADGFAVIGRRGRHVARVVIPVESS